MDIDKIRKLTDEVEGYLAPKQSPLLHRLARSARRARRRLQSPPRPR